VLRRIRSASSADAEIVHHAAGANAAAAGQRQIIRVAHVVDKSNFFLLAHFSDVAVHRAQVLYVIRAPTAFRLARISPLAARDIPE
jgi:hypothetical protein